MTLSDGKLTIELDSYDYQDAKIMIIMKMTLKQILLTKIEKSYQIKLIKILKLYQLTRE